MSEIFFLFIKMKSLVIIIAILSVNGVRAGENNGPNIAEVSMLNNIHSLI